MAASTSSTSCSSSAGQLWVMFLFYLVVICWVAATPSLAATTTTTTPCSRRMEQQSPILYKLCLYYTHETGVDSLEHEDGKWIEDAKNLLLQNSNDGSIKREEPRVHHMFIRFGKRR